METTLILPFLALLAVGLFELGGIFVTYLQIQQIVHEGSTFGSSIVGLEVTPNSEQNTYYTGSPVLPTGFDLPATKHRAVIARMMQLTGIQGQMLNVENITYLSIRTNPSGVVGNPGPYPFGAVKTSIRVRYRAIFNLFSGFVFSTGESTAYTAPQP